MAGSTVFVIKALVLVSCTAVLVSMAAGADDAKETKKVLADAIRRCMKKGDIPEEEIPDLNLGNKTNHKCFFNCLAKEVNVFSNGRMHIKRLVELAHLVVDPSNHKKMFPTVLTCLRNVSPDMLGADCEALYKFRLCAMKGLDTYPDIIEILKN